MLTATFLDIFSLNTFYRELFIDFPKYDLGQKKFLLFF